MNIFNIYYVLIQYERVYKLVGFNGLLLISHIMKSFSTLGLLAIVACYGLDEPAMTKRISKESEAALDMLYKRLKE